MRFRMQVAVAEHFQRIVHLGDRQPDQFPSLDKGAEFGAFKRVSERITDIESDRVFNGVDGVVMEEGACIGGLDQDLTIEPPITTTAVRTAPRLRRATSAIRPIARTTIARNGRAVLISRPVGDAPTEDLERDGDA